MNCAQSTFLLRMLDESGRPCIRYRIMRGGRTSLAGRKEVRREFEEAKLQGVSLRVFFSRL